MPVGMVRPVCGHLIITAPLPVSMPDPCLPFCGWLLAVRAWYWSLVVKWCDDRLTPMWWVSEISPLPHSRTTQSHKRTNFESHENQNVESTLTWPQPRRREMPDCRGNASIPAAVLTTDASAMLIRSGLSQRLIVVSHCHDVILL